MPRHTFETFKDLGLQGTTFKPRVPPVRVPVAAGPCAERPTPVAAVGRSWFKIKF